MTWMEIGLFQLENLSMTPARYVYFDLRLAQDELPPALMNLMRRAQHVTPDQAELHLRQAKADGQTPILMVCETGERSRALAQQLASRGYEQIYVVADGVRGLLSELSP